MSQTALRKSVPPISYSALILASKHALSLSLCRAFFRRVIMSFFKIRSVQTDGSILTIAAFSSTHNQNVVRRVFSASSFQFMRNLIHNSFQTLRNEKRLQFSTGVCLVFVAEHDKKLIRGGLLRDCCSGPKVSVV